MLVLRSSNKNRRSYNNFQWPKSGPVEAPDWDPVPECGKGLHGLANGRGKLWHLDLADPTRVFQVVEVEDDLVVDLGDKIKFPKGNVIYSGELEGALKLFAKGKSVREWVCEDPEWAYWYARNVDKEPREDTRLAVCEDPERAYHYARDVDKEPREDTRLAACKDPWWAYRYALNVDKEPREDTRLAACKDPWWAYLYARNVDKEPREDTRLAVCEDPERAYRYARDVDKE